MPTLELSETEARLLKEMLEADLSDLRMEISSTDLMSFRNELHQKEDVIKRLIQRLKSA